MTGAPCCASKLWLRLTATDKTHTRTSDHARQQHATMFMALTSSDDIQTTLETSSTLNPTQHPATVNLKTLDTCSST
eukprot:2015385-Rhodomonas_salina.2